MFPVNELCESRDVAPANQINFCFREFCFHQPSRDLLFGGYGANTLSGKQSNCLVTWLRGGIKLRQKCFLRLTSRDAVKSQSEEIRRLGRVWRVTWPAANEECVGRSDGRRWPATMKQRAAITGPVASVARKKGKPRQKCTAGARL